MRQWKQVSGYTCRCLLIYLNRQYRVCSLVAFVTYEDFKAEIESM